MGGKVSTRYTIQILQPLCINKGYPYTQNYASMNRLRFMNCKRNFGQFYRLPK